jgi:TMEM175 potassium channel family protein
VKEVRAVPANRDTPRGCRPLETDRLAAFSEGVFAIAAALLVLDSAVHPPGPPLQQMFHGWPRYVAYVVSFLTIGGAWLLHTALTERLTRSTPILAPSRHSRRDTPDHAP